MSFRINEELQALSRHLQKAPCQYRSPAERQGTDIEASSHLLESFSSAPLSATVLSDLLQCMIPAHMRESLVPYASLTDVRQIS